MTNDGSVTWLTQEAFDRRTRTLGAEIRTTELAVTGLIYRCWLT